MIDTPTAHGAPLFEAEFKRRPEDFVVTEELSIDFDGAGEHLWLWVEKQGVDTLALIEQLQKGFSVGSADIGHSGLKDRVALTRQWISVRTSLPVTEVELEGARIIDSVRHGRKLRHGTHTGNHFDIVLRNVLALPAAELLRQSVEHRLDAIREKGFPNYLGPQRFGIGGRNLVQAEQWFRNPKKRLSRAKRGFLLSAARSALFNAVCAERVRQGSWDRLLPGEPAILAGTRSFFVPEADDQSATQRCTELDVHPSGPWWGRGAALAINDCARLEQGVLVDHERFCTGLEGAGLEQERRALRATVPTLSHEWLSEQDLRLRFSLSPGVFATTLLAECGRCMQFFAAPNNKEGDDN